MINEKKRSTGIHYELEKFQSRINDLLRNPHQYNLFRAAYLIERKIYIDEKLNRKNKQKSNLRFMGVSTLSFESSDLHSIESSLRIPNTIAIKTPFMSLASNSGPLPQPFCELILERERDKDFATSDFLDIFYNRIIHLFYYSRKKRNVSLCWNKNNRSIQEKIIDNIASLGRNVIEFKSASSSQWLNHAGIFAGAPRSVLNLTSLLRDRLRINDIECGEFKGSWVDISAANKKLAISGDTPVLGVDAVLGRRAWNLSSGFLISFNNLSKGNFLSLLPTGKKFSELVSIVRRFLPSQFRIYLRLNIDKSSYKNTQLLEGKQVRLGWNTWLGNLENSMVVDSVNLEFEVNETRL